ncbi:fungal-specific transcription factor domain-containing protein [Stachybotrys elegans]|uniref:Fungal-specific transcription factor domain-containing protein n=1 Tax=Stachybotrys elegans TaxID=80388 RepID=A0A8K0SDK0_9HYPO|nr:fungal-specific transcription factor domain-containing protein [Stachybotrys elegans]
MADTATATRKDKRLRGSGAQSFVTRACDACRRKKIRCELTKDKCLQCVKLGTQCHFTPISGTRKVQKPAQNEYILELEAKVKEMEGQLQITHKLGIGPKSYPLETTNSGNVLYDMLLRHSQTQSVDASFGGQSFPHMMDLVRPQWNIDPPLPTYLELPPKSSALVLINEAFRSFIRYFPIFDEQRFMKMFEVYYPPDGFQDLAWWASVNVALSLGYIFRAIRTSQSHHDMARSYGHTKNILAVLSQLIALPDSTAAIQSLLGVILILEGTPNSQMCPVLIVTAMGLVQSMGLHRRDRYPPGLSPTEIEERKNIFWITYWIEKNIAYLRRQPSVQDDDDIDVDLPTGTVSEPHELGRGPATINIFNSRIGLAIIQGQIYKKLFSVQAKRQSEVQLAATAQEINGLLACWRANIPFDFGESSVTDLRLPLPEDVLQIIILHTVYVDCVITVDRHLPPRDSLQAELADLDTDAFPSERVCIMESRKVIHLLQKIPRGKYAIVWLLVGSFFEAATVLLHNIIRDPFHVRARSDISLIEPFLDLLGILDDHGDNAKLQRMREQCNGLIQNAIASMNILEDAVIGALVL